LSSGLTCPKCSSANVRWVTMHRAVPIDVLQCQDCSTTIAEEDWMAPLLPMLAGRCMNCGDRRERGACRNCGLTEAEDHEVHDELRQVVAPNGNLLAAAREASRQGRRLIAVKLATAAAATNEEGQGETARALRIWLLAAIGEAQAALEDAKAWVEHAKDASAIGWASLGQQYQHNGFTGSAAEAYGKSLAKDQRQHTIRARRAVIMLGMRREGQACDEAAMVLGASDADDQAIALGLEVIDALAERYETQLRDDEVERMFTLAGPHVDRSPKLLAQRARIAALNGDVTAAKRDLKLARKIDPNLTELYERIDRAIKPAKTSWWRW
jgi:tetratricopeptide (TPR) repeat protein